VPEYLRISGSASGPTLSGLAVGHRTKRHNSRRRAIAAPPHPQIATLAPRTFLRNRAAHRGPLFPILSFQFRIFTF